VRPDVGLGRPSSRVDVVFGAIPGHRSPRLVSESVGVYAAAYSEALRGLGRRAVICGVSLGGVVGLAIRSPWAVGVLALDPPLRPDDAPHLLRALAGHDAPDFLWRVFGVGDGRQESRDYMPALRGLQAPVTIFAGNQAPRRDQRLAGAISDDTFQRLTRIPGVTAQRFPGCGHDLGYGATEAIVTEIQRRLAAHGDQDDEHLAHAAR